MISGKNFIGFSPSAKGEKTIQSVEASKGENLEGNFHISTAEEVELAVLKAETAFKTYSKLSGTKKASFLDEIANEIEALGDDLIQRASLESGLPNGRFQGERGRTTGQLRLFASLLREGSWVDAIIDPALPDRKPMPRADIRNMLVPMGPVVIFTASNFPLAFSTAGGDTASALASGCPVIIKAHESHLGVNDLVSGAIIRAAQKTNMPDGVFSSLNGNGYETGQALVQHKRIKAVAFTGSFKGGKALYDLAQSRKEPIPVFAEMGSINPVILLEDKLQNDAVGLANLYAGSITLGVGQFCTNPGLLIAVKSEALNQFATELTNKLNDIAPSIMLNAGITENYSSMRTKVLSEGNVLLATKEKNENALPTLARTTGNKFLENNQLHQEVFGPFSLLVECENKEELETVIAALEGQLTGTIMGTSVDLNTNANLIDLLQNKVGRLIFNAAPTGVEVSHAMNHGGPFPATTDSRFTSVGTGAIKRFVRPMCFQGMPDSILPEALKNANPLNLLRTINGEQTKSSIA